MSKKRHIGPYGAIESWIYDRIVAPAMAGVEATVLDLIADALPSKEGRISILDVGCGGGQAEVGLLERISKKEGGQELDIVALEPSAKLMAYAQKRTAALAGRVACVRGIAQNLPLVDGSFDCVFSIASIKHWPDPGKGLKECVRVLKPGGVLLVFEANKGLTPEEVRSFARSLKLPFFFKPLIRRVFQIQVAGMAFDEGELRGFTAPLEGGGLEIQEVRSVEGTPMLAIRGLRIASRLVK